MSSQGAAFIKFEIYISAFIKCGNMCSEIYNITIHFTEWYEHILSDYAGIDFFHEICVRPCDFIM